MFREITETDVASLYPNWDMIIKNKKELKKMKREYIVVHLISAEKVGIIFKDSIKAVVESDTIGETEIIVSDRSIFVSDSYKEIVKQLFK